MKNLLIIALAICTSKIAFSQTPLMEAYVGQPNQIKLNLPTNVVGNSGKCNIDVIIPDMAIYGQEVEAPNFDFSININPQQIGDLTVKWEGKTKFRGLGTVMGCPGSGSFQITVKDKINQVVVKASEPVKSTFNWVSIGGNDTADYFYDTASLTGELTNRTIFIKANIKTAGTDGSLSRLLKYSINCNDGTILMELMKTYTITNLQGQEKDVKLSEGRARNKPNPNTLGASYVSNACNASNLNQAKTDTNNANRQTPLSSWPNTTASVNVSALAQKSSLQYFSKINPEKNTQKAFEGVMNEEQQQEIAWAFIFANNINLKINQGQNYTSFRESFSKYSPIMKDGLVKYYSTFDRIASSLGVPRAIVMKEFGIAINQGGLANFTDDRNYDIESQMNLYIYFFAIESKSCGFLDVQCQKIEQENRRDKAYFQRDLRQFYQQRPPPILYGVKVDEDIIKIDRFYQLALSNANRIETQLIAEENERQRQEKEAAIRRETERQRSIELARQRDESEKIRQDFLKSPAGQKQIAEQREAKERIEKEKAAKDKLTAENCEKATSMSVGAAESLASQLRVSVSSISIRRTTTFMGCEAVIDTPKGIYKCRAEVMSKEGRVWLHFFPITDCNRG